MKKFLLLFLFVAIAGGYVSAQSDGLPPSPEPGKCYVKCVSHDEFKKETEQVMIKPAYKILKIVPATYKWVEERVEIKEASKKMIYHPAVYEWKTVPYVKKAGQKVLKVVPAKFGKDNVTVEIFPETGGWEYSRYSDCKSPNPDDCRVLCYIEIPPKYKVVPIKTLVSDATTTESNLPDKNTTYKKRVVVKKAWVEEIPIPAEFAVIKRQVIDQPAKVTEKVIPAVYKTVSKQVLVKKGGISTWEEIDCGLVKPNILDILWNLNSAKLRPDAKRKVDEVLLTLLRNKPNISIELSSHTDSRGSAEYNTALSQRRADAIKNYLISKGIAADRIVSKGYGETRLKNNCSDGVSCTEAQHQVNRRTEYRVIGSQ